MSYKAPIKATLCYFLTQNKWLQNHGYSGTVVQCLVTGWKVSLSQPLCPPSLVSALHNFSEWVASQCYIHYFVWHLLYHTSFQHITCRGIIDYLYLALLHATFPSVRITRDTKWRQRCNETETDGEEKESHMWEEKGFSYFVKVLLCLGRFINPTCRYVTSWEWDSILKYLSGVFLNNSDK